MIRVATQDDVSSIVAMGAEFHAYSPWAYVAYDEEAVTDFVSKLIAGGVVFLSEDGMCGGLISPSYFNPSHLVGVELFWWARKGGKELRTAFEDWAEQNNASAVQFSALGDSRANTVEALFKRAGYRKIETGYLKEL